MKFIDETVITVRAGNGGSGCLSFRREKYIPFGGPDGGDGGNGGSIIIRGTDSLNTLADFRNKSIFTAENGKAGGSRNKHGRNGEDLIIDLPLGCVITDNITNEELCDLDKEDKITNQQMPPPNIIFSNLKFRMRAKCKPFPREIKHFEI